MLAVLRTKALVKINEILDLPLPSPEDADYARMAAIQKDAATGILTASLKADENCFRRRETNALERLYEAVKSEKAKRQPLTIDNPV